ncbi:hypothetical protein HDU91_000974, partial [Kappamyces sp. JEL0680]
MDPIVALKNLEKVQELIHLVTRFGLKSHARAYYHNAEIIVMDVLLHNDFVRDDQLANGIGMNVKDLQKVCGRLKGQGLLQVISRFEEIPMSKETLEKIAAEVAAHPSNASILKRERRKINRSYYFLDYGNAVNVIKYKVFKIQKLIDSQADQASVIVPYSCSTCGHTYAALEMLSLDQTSEGIFLCEIDQGELVADDLVDTNAGNAQFQKLPIIELLKQLDDLYIPESKPQLPDPTNNTALAAITRFLEGGSGATTAANSVARERELKIAQGSGNPQNQVSVEFEENQDSQDLSNAEKGKSCF